MSRGPGTAAVQGRHVRDGGQGGRRQGIVDRCPGAGPTRRALPRERPGRRLQQLHDDNYTQELGPTAYGALRRQAIFPVDTVRATATIGLWRRGKRPLQKGSINDPLGTGRTTTTAIGSTTATRPTRCTRTRPGRTIHTTGDGGCPGTADGRYSLMARRVSSAEATSSGCCTCRGTCVSCSGAGISVSLTLSSVSLRADTSTRLSNDETVEL